MDLVLGIVQVLVQGELGRRPLAVRLGGCADDVWDTEKEFLKKKNILNSGLVSVVTELCVWVSLGVMSHRNYFL